MLFEKGADYAESKNALVVQQYASVNCLFVAFCPIISEDLLVAYMEVLVLSLYVNAKKKCH